MTKIKGVWWGVKIKNSDVIFAVFHEKWQADEYVMGHEGSEVERLQVEILRV